MQIADRSYIIINKEYFKICQQQLKYQDEHDFTYILEPEGRNTASAIAVASLALQKIESEKILLFSYFPVIIFFNPEQLYNAINKALPAVSEDNKIAVLE